MKEEQKLAFLKEYKKLCLEHGMELKGCGDCGSAWLSVLEKEKIKNAKLSWTEGFENVQFAGKYELEDKFTLKDNF